MCTWFSSLASLVRAHVGEDTYKSNLKRAIRHLEFVVELYQMQVDAGRFFLHENPVSACSWNQKCMMDFMARELAHGGESHVQLRHEGPGWLRW